MGLRDAIRGVEALEKKLAAVAQRQREVQAEFDKAKFPVPGPGGPVPAGGGISPLGGTRSAAGPPAAGSGGGGGGGVGEGGAAPSGENVYIESLLARGCKEGMVSIPDPSFAGGGLRELGIVKWIKVKAVICPFIIPGHDATFLVYPGQVPTTPGVSGRSSGSSAASGGGGGGGGTDPTFVHLGGIRGRQDNPEQRVFGGSNEGAADSEAADDSGKSLTAGDKAIVGELRRLNENLHQSPADRRAASEGLY